MEISFHNKKILVTGAGQGMGRCFVKRLVQCGADVVAVSLIEEELRTLKQELPQVTTITCDVTDSKKVRQLVAAHGPYHGLVNNAGIIQLQPFLEVTEESFDRMINVNLKAVMVISQVVAKMMVENKIEGSIVNISSQASTIGVRDHTGYCASKGGLETMNKVMALELGNYGIRSNCIRPTVVMTELGKVGWSDPKKAKTMKDRIPLGRFAEVDEVADAVLFLLSDKSKMINGVGLLVDGGFMAN